MLGPSHNGAVRRQLHSYPNPEHYRPCNTHLPPRNSVGAFDSYPHPAFFISRLRASHRCCWTTLDSVVQSGSASRLLPHHQLVCDAAFDRSPAAGPQPIKTLHLLLRLCLHSICGLHFFHLVSLSAASRRFQSLHIADITFSFGFRPDCALFIPTAPKEQPQPLPLDVTTHLFIFSPKLLSRCTEHLAEIIAKLFSESTTAPSHFCSAFILPLNVLGEASLYIISYSSALS